LIISSIDGSEDIGVVDVGELKVVGVSHSSMVGEEVSRTIEFNVSFKFMPNNHEKKNIHPPIILHNTRILDQKKRIIMNKTKRNKKIL
jgi:hypothetical protein